jgi:hypothetical protein
MREFGISAPKNIFRGLRPFPNPLSGEEYLVECYNFEPTTQSLRAHEFLPGVGFAIPTVQYLGIKDQNDVVWYWIADINLGVLVFDSLPDLLSAGFALTSLLGLTIPYWLQVDAVDNLATQLYIFPAPISGDVLVDTGPPVLGTGYDAGTGLIMRALSGYQHRLAAITSLDSYWSQIGV